MTESRKAGRVVLADVGGTNVRFAVLETGVLGPVDHMAVADYRHFVDALAGFMSHRTGNTAIRYALLAVAGVVEGSRCALTNYPWIVDGNELRARFGFDHVHIINDFEAVGWSLPHFALKDLLKIGGREAVSDAPMLALGPGTGLGVAVYVPRGEGAFVLRSEGGHSTMPSGSAREDAIIETLRQRFGHVSAERILSGHGLENLYRAIASHDSLSVPERSAAEITDAALAGHCVASRAAIDTFCAMLGEVAGNLALSTGARGGVYVAGGIAAHLREYLPHSQFRARFEAKGRMSPYVSEIPVYLILHDDPAFLGLRSLAARRAWIS
ncbi:MAG: glucokinase [Pseudolabrys sp.]